MSEVKFLIGDQADLSTVERSDGQFLVAINNNQATAYIDYNNARMPLGGSGGSASTFIGATSVSDGIGGSVPAPTSYDVHKYIKGNGNWSTVLESEIGADECETTFNQDGSITEVTSVGTKTTVFNQDGSILETYPDGKMFLTEFNQDGSISKTLYTPTPMPTPTPTPTTRTMTAKFDLTDSNPETWGTYYDDAIGMTVGSDAWDEFFGHYPCILDNGVELGKLKRDNFAQYEDGSSAPITTLGKDVMIAFPKRGIKLSIDNDILTVSMTDAENVPGYSYMAHSYKGNPCSTFYLGAYKGYVSGDKLYSVSGQTPTVNRTIRTFRTQAQARGTGYEQSAFFQLTYRQVMYMLKYRGQNAQIVVGHGFVNGNSAAHATGGTNSLGMDYGESTGKVQMKLFGLEDFYGNVFEFIDGIYSNSNRQIYVADGNFNDTGSGYTSAGTVTFSNDIIGYMKLPNGTNLAGFTQASTSYGSATTFFCDYSYLMAERLSNFGGYWNDVNNAGVFRFSASSAASNSSAYHGARLMYMKLAS